MPSNFEVGDKVYINPPENWYEFPSWTSSMDEEINTDIAYVVRWVGDDIVDLSGLPYNFSPHWLELANEKEIVTGPYAQVIKKIKQLDKRFEERKKNLYDLAA
jgi:hypothetical protein